MRPDGAPDGAKDAATAIVLGTGSGRRLGADQPKAFLTVGGRPILAMAAMAAAASPRVSSVIVMVPQGFEERAMECTAESMKPVTVMQGGESRQASVRAALQAVPRESEIVAIHDAARPFAPPELFTFVVHAVSRGAAGAVPVVPIIDTVKRVEAGRVVSTEDRAVLSIAQTPQAFRTAAIREAHDRAARDGLVVTDDSALMELAHSVQAIPGDPANFKITTLMDLARAEERMGAGG